MTSSYVLVSIQPKEVPYLMFSITTSIQSCRAGFIVLYGSFGNAILGFVPKSEDFFILFFMETLFSSRKRKPKTVALLAKEKDE